MRRVVSLWLPRLASDLAGRRPGGGAGSAALGSGAPGSGAPGSGAPGPMAIVGRQGRGDVLVCLNALAEAQGLRRGQSLSEARALVPLLATRPQDLRRQEQALAGLRRWALRYAPWVCTDGADGLLIDISGAAHLMGGEAPLAEDLRARLEAMGFAARLAVAPTRGAAWALARHGAAPLMFAEDAGEAVAGLPMAALRLPEETCAALARLGLRQVRDLARAARGALVRRFGAELMLRLDQATGALAEPLAAPGDAPHFAIRLTLPEPIGLASDVRAGLERLLARLCTRLAAADRGARRLRLDLQRSDGSRAEAEITLARPMRDAAAMAALFERVIDSLDAGFGFDVMRLTAPLTEALAPAQLTGAQMAGAQMTGADEMADLLTRLGNRLGLEALTRFLPADSHIPERAFLTAAAAFTEAPGAGAWPGGVRRPLVLFPPEPLIGVQGAQPPLRFRWRRRALTTVRALGPERLAPEWWLDDPEWRSGMRDYWRLDTAEGPRLWAFWTPQAPGWAVQGEFA